MPSWMKDLLEQWDDFPQVKFNIAKQPGHDGGVQKVKHKAGAIEVFDVEARRELVELVEGVPIELRGYAKLKLREVVVDEDAGDVSVDMLVFKVGGGLYTEFDLREYANDALEYLDLKRAPLPELSFSTSNAWAARVGDATAHGAPLSPGLGASTVFIEGQPAMRAAVDFHVCPACNGTIPHVGGVVAPGAPDVFIEGFPAVRVGDAVVEACGPNPILVGASQVEIGAPPPPVSYAPMDPAHEDDWRIIEIECVEAKVELGSGLEAEAKASYSRKKGFSASKAKGDASLLRGKFTETYRVRLFGDWASILVGSSSELRAVTAGAEYSPSSNPKLQGGAGWWGAYTLEPIFKVE